MLLSAREEKESYREPPVRGLVCARNDTAYDEREIVKYNQREKG